VLEINSRTVLLNMLALFWITIIPFGAKNAAERPLDPLGASLTSAAAGLFFLSLNGMRLSAHSAIDDDPRLRNWRNKRLALSFACIAVLLVCSVVAWVTPWPAYAALLGNAVLWLAMPSPPEAEQRIQAKSIQPPPSP
jgi:uncharacterized membrane protein